MELLLRGLRRGAADRGRRRHRPAAGRRRTATVWRSRAAASLGTMRADLTKVRQVALQPAQQRQQVHRDGHHHASTADARGRMATANGSASACADTGIGMTPEQLGRSSRPSPRPTPRPPASYGGTGLGLAISRHFCRDDGRRHRRSTSEPGRGSTFTRPAARSGVEKATTAAAESQRRRAQGSGTPSTDGPRDRRRRDGARPDRSASSARRASGVLTAASGEEGLRAGPGSAARRHHPRRDDARHGRLGGAAPRSRPTRTWPRSR